MQQTTIWTNVDPIHRRIYAVLGGDEAVDRQTLEPDITRTISLNHMT